MGYQHVVHPQILVVVSRLDVKGWMSWMLEMSWAQVDGAPMLALITTWWWVSMKATLEDEGGSSRAPLKGGGSRS